MFLNWEQKQIWIVSRSGRKTGFSQAWICLSCKIFLPLPREGTSSATPSPLLSHAGRWEQGLHLPPAHGHPRGKPRPSWSRAQARAQGRWHPSVPGTRCSPAADFKRLPPAVTDPRSLGAANTARGGTERWRITQESAERPGQFVSPKRRYGLFPVTVLVLFPQRAGNLPAMVWHSPGYLGTAQLPVYQRASMARGSSVLLRHGPAVSGSRAPGSLSRSLLPTGTERSKAA